MEFSTAEDLQMLFGLLLIQTSQAGISVSFILDVDKVFYKSLQFFGSFGLNFCLLIQ